MSENLILSYPNKVNSATLSGGDFETLLPVTNLAEKELWKVARTTDATLPNTQFSVDLESWTTIKCLALANHNLSTFAKWKISIGSAAGDNDIYAGVFENVWETEELIGGLFDQGEDWSLGEDWLVSDGLLSHIDGTGSTTSQRKIFNQMTAGNSYLVRINATDVSADSFFFNQVGGPNGIEITSTGFYSEIIELDAGTTNVGIYGSGAFVGTMDSISLQEVTQYIDNHDFTDGTNDWTDNSMGTGTISEVSEELVLDYIDSSNRGRANQSIALVIGSLYTMHISITSSRSVYLSAIGSISSGMTLAPGKHTITFEASVINSLISVLASPTGSGDATIAYLSVTEAHNLADNAEFSSDRVWSKGTDWTISGGLLTHAAGTGTTTSQVELFNRMTAGSYYRVVIEATGITAGEFFFNQVGGPDGETRITNGVYTEIIKLDAATSNVGIFGNGTFVGSIDKIIVEEVTLVDGNWVTADELVSNGSFNGVLHDWNTGNSALLTTDAGRLKVTPPADDTYAAGYKSFTTTIGQQYELSIDFALGDATYRYVRLGTGTSGASAKDVASVDNANISVGTNTIKFIALSETTYLHLGSYDLDDPNLYSRISIKKANAANGHNPIIEDDCFKSSFVAFSVLPSFVSGRYLTIEIDDTTNPDGYIQIGRFFVGSGIQPTYNMSYGLQDNLGDLSTGSMSESGSFWSIERRRLRDVSFVLDWVTLDQGDEIHDMQMTLGTVNEVLYIPYPDDLEKSQRYGFLGRLSELSPIEYPHYNNRSTAFKIKELG